MKNEVITAKDIAKMENVNIATIRHRWNAAFAKGTFNQNAPLSPEQVAAISRNSSQAIAKPIRQPIVHKPVPAAKSEPPARQKINFRFAMLSGLLLTATAASVQNMYRVTCELSEANMSAMLLTVVLSASAIVFVVSGVRNWWTIALAVILIAYESMCNMTRIHAGLYSASGNPTHFLTQFCDTFNAGTNQAAFVLSAFTAFFIAAVQYAAVFELNRK